jgi:multidrug efflux pump
VGSFATGSWTYGSPRLERYNGVSSVEIQGAAAPGMSTGQAMAAMEQMVAKLPAGIGFEWTGMSLEEKTSGKQAPLLYGISVLVVFLCLAALYESWSVPFAVMMVVPLGMFGAIMFTRFENLNNDIYFQVGMLAVMGLSAKNAILIIEFAKELQEVHGETLINSILHAVRMRLRPIIMTSLAFGLGVVPLVLSNGAGAGSQNAVGTGVLGGVISATFLGIFFIPVFYFWISSLFKSKPKQPATITNNNIQEP